MKSYKHCVVFLMVCWASQSIACDLCRGIGTIENRDPCSECFGRGKFQQWETVRCGACNGVGSITYRLQGTHYGQSASARCRKCSGKGNISVKTFIPCTKCNGARILVTRVACYRCKGKPRENEETISTTIPTEAVDKVDKVEVDQCSNCDVKGKVGIDTLCDRCEKGFCHRKVDNKYVCRKCGKACQGCFSPCACGNPDCPVCDGAYIKHEKMPCPFCGGDGIITPFERLRGKK